MRKVKSYNYKVQDFIDRELRKVGHGIDEVLGKRLNSLVNLIDVQAVKRYTKEVD